jgi:ABC-type transport system substrate-binding protein
VFKILPDATAAANATANGDIGWEPDLTSSAIDKLKGNSGVRVFEYPDLSYYDVRFNDRPDHLFGDKLVRQAFAYAIDKEAITRRVTGGHGVTLWRAPSAWTSGWRRCHSTTRPTRPVSSTHLRKHSLTSLLPASPQPRTRTHLTSSIRASCGRSTTPMG